MPAPPSPCRPNGTDATGDGTAPTVAAPAPEPADATGGATEPATPFRWRVAALALVAGGVVTGDTVARRMGARGAMAFVGAGLPALTVPLLLGERRWRTHSAAGAPWAVPHGPPAPGRPAGAAILPPISVVVAARDEARAVRHLLADLGRQDHREPDGRPCFEVVVIDDRSVDGTADAATAAAAGAGIGPVTRVIPRRGDGIADGKGAALIAAPPSTLHGDVVVVLDADARVAPGFLRRVAAQMAAGRPALSCPIAIQGEGVSARAQGAEQRLDVAIQRARFAMGGLPEFRGNGIVVRRDVLAAAGGWRAVLTEDLDLSSRLAILGHRVGVARDVQVEADAVPDLCALWIQRLRWAEGALRRSFEHGVPVMTARRLGPVARAEFAIYVGQLAVPGVVLGAAVGTVRHRRPSALLGIAATWGLALAIVGRSPLAAAASAVWIAAVPAASLRLAFRRGPVRYAKMEHIGLKRERST